jgi:hypothetical protein
MMTFYVLESIWDPQNVKISTDKRLSILSIVKRSRI